MGSYNMAVNKILSVLLVAGSTPAWTNPQFFNFNQNSFATERPLSAGPTTTPVSILRYVDTQNIDGSYTYGYEAADGTYKLETRYVDGRVKGKYGYIDPEGNLREASYGAEAGRGFEPKIEGVELPVVAPAEAFNEISEQVPQKQFQNFAPVNGGNRVTTKNGRRALLKKVRRVKATPAPQQFIDEQATKQANLKARQNQLRTLEQHRRQLLEVQQQQQQQSVNSRQQQQQSRSFSSFPSRQQESFRSAAPVPAPVAVTSDVSDPYVTGFDINSGSYSISY